MKKKLTIFNCLIDCDKPFIGEREKARLSCLKARLWRERPRKRRKKRNSKRKRFIKENNRNNYKTYINSDKWFERRNLYFESHLKKCSRCGATQYIHLHHITYKSFGREKDLDLAPLCKDCHKEYHNKHSHNDRVGFNQFIEAKENTLI